MNYMNMKDSSGKTQIDKGTLQFVVVIDFQLLLATSGGVGDVELQNTNEGEITSVRHR